MDRDRGVRKSADQVLQTWKEAEPLGIWLQDTAIETQGLCWGKQAGAVFKFGSFSVNDAPASAASGN